MTSPIKDKESSASHALVRAAASGDLPEVESLLARGVDINCPNEDGQTALIRAALMGHAEVVAHLISAGADANMRDRLNLTALEWSTRRGFPEVTRLLTKISPPLQPLRIERKKNQTDSATQSSELTTTDREPASPEAPASLETAASKIEKESSEELGTLAPQSELVEISTSENLSEPASVVTESAPALPAVPPPVALVANESESQPTATELEVPAPVTEPSPEIKAPAVNAAPADLEATPAPATEPSPEISAAAVNAAPAESEVLPEPTTEPSPEISAAVVNAAPAESEVLPEPTTEPSPEVSAAVVNAAPAELELPPAPTSEPSPEISAPALSAAPSSDLQSSDSAYDAAGMFSTEPILFQEEDETLPQPGVPTSTVDIRFPQAPSATASAQTREAPPPAGLTSEPGNRPAPFSGSKLGRSTSAATEVKTGAPNLKRCPRCGAVYQNSPLSFCTRDNATLIGIDEFHPYIAPTQTQTSSTPIGVWLLIAFVLGASGFAAYRFTESFYRQPEPTPAAVKPVEPPPEVKKTTFSVGGNLAGRELTIPEPEYPSDLIAAGITGPITVRVRVNKSGRVISASSSPGDSRLRSAAVRAARQATFAPDKLAEISPRGRAVTGTITYEFAAPQTSAATSTSTTSTTAAPGSSPVPSSAPANADPNAPVMSSELMSAASNVPPADYPSGPRRAGIGGAITVTVRVNRNGKVVSWRSSPGDSQLRAAAIKAARKATFAREKLPGGGDVVGTITYTFTP